MEMFGVGPGLRHLFGITRSSSKPWAHGLSTLSPPDRGPNQPKGSRGVWASGQCLRLNTDWTPDPWLPAQSSSHLQQPGSGAVVSETGEIRTPWGFSPVVSRTGTRNAGQGKFSWETGGTQSGCSPPTLIGGNILKPRVARSGRGEV